MKKNITTRSLSVRVHPQNNESFKAAIRSLVLFNLSVNLYSAQLRKAINGDDPQLSDIISNNLTGHKSRTIIGDFLESKTKERNEKRYPDLKDDYFDGNLFPDVSKALGINKDYEWKRAAFSLASQRVSSQIELKKLRSIERKERDAEIENEFGKLKNEEWWARCKIIEKELSKYYSSEYKITFGRLRGWSKIRKIWIRSLQNEESLIQALNEYQTKNSRKFGDRVLFEKLAEKENIFLWFDQSNDEPQNEGYDHLSIFAKYNRKTKNLRGIGFAWPNAFQHPVWLHFGNTSNQVKLLDSQRETIRNVGSNRLPLELQFLNSNLDWQSFQFEMSKNNRVNNQKINTHGFYVTEEGKSEKTNLYKTSFIIKGIKQLFDRDKLRECFSLLNNEQKRFITSPIKSKEDLSNCINNVEDIVKTISEKITPFSLKLSITIELEKSEVSEIHKRNLNNKKYLSFFKDNNSSSIPIYVPREIKKGTFSNFIGMKFLGVDLGIKSPASWALVNITEQSSASQRRVLELGEDVYGLISKTGHVKLSEKLGSLDKAKEELNTCFSLLKLANTVLYSYVNKKQLPQATGKHIESFGDKTDLLGVWRKINYELVQKRKTLKKTVYQKNTGEISFSKLEFLNSFIIFEKKFLSRSKLDKNNNIILGQKRKGYDYIRDLHEHKSNIANDRCKKIANKILTVALRNNVDAIVLEDLSRYNFFEGRSKKENSQLMQWCHKQIYNYLREMTELFSIPVFRVNCAYTSRFDPKTGAPGIRINKLDKTYYTNKSDKPDDPAWKFHPGGDYFFTFHEKDGNKTVKHDANINAAINIFKRCFVPNQNYLRAKFNNKKKCYRVESGPYKGKYINKKNDNEFTLTDNKDEAKIDELHPDEIVTEKTLRLFKDESGIMFSHWVPANIFWERVHARLKSDLTGAQ